MLQCITMPTHRRISGQVTGADLRRWQARFQAVEAEDRETLRREGPRPEWSIALSLSMIEAARSILPSRRPDPAREAEDAAVIRAWDRLRLRFGT